MHESKYDEEYKEERNFAKHNLIWLVMFVIVVGVFLTVMTFMGTRGVDIVDNGILHYEEFQEIYNTTAKINTDLGTLRAIPESDPMFAQFSKWAMITAKKQQMSRWVEEYNSKSMMLNRSLWKSRKLPYQLKVDDFSNYEDKR